MGRLLGNALKINIITLKKRRVKGQALDYNAVTRLVAYLNHVPNCNLTVTMLPPFCHCFMRSLWRCC